MRIETPLENGYLPDAYGKYASETDKAGWSCRRSFPFTVHDIPEDTRALAIVFLDWDSTPVCGFPWIHWCALVEGPFDGEFAMPDDASRSGMPRMAQGYNSAAKNEPERGTGYAGPCPPDADHVYTLRVAALDFAPRLSEPFWCNELIAASRSHALAETTLQLPSRR